MIHASSHDAPAAWAAQERQQVRRATLWGVGAAVGLTVVGVTGVLSQAESLPPYVATNWNGKVVTATMSLPAFLLQSAAMVVLGSLPFTVLAARSGPGPRAMFTGIACGAAVFLAGATFGAVLAQRGLAGPYDALNPVTAILGSALMGAAVGVLAAWAVQDPRTRVGVDEVEDHPVLRERVLADRPAWIMLGLMAAVPVLFLVVMGLPWWLVAALVMLAALLLSSCAVTVEVDEYAVRVLGFGLVPWVRYPLTVVRSATIGRAAPPLPWAVALRRRGGDLSLLVRDGEALRLELMDGTTVTLSAAQAGHAASLIRDGAARDARTRAA